MYEEIGEVVKETFMFTRNALYGVSSPISLDGAHVSLQGGQERVTIVPEARNCEYEDVDAPLSTGGGKSSRSAGEASYQMKECSAYGANN